VLSSTRVAVLLSILALFTGISVFSLEHYTNERCKEAAGKGCNDSPGRTRCAVSKFLSNALIGTFDVETLEKGCSFQPLARAAFELYGEGVQAEGTQEVTAHAALDGIHGANGLFDPLEGEGVGEALEVGALVDVADAIGCA